MSAPTAFLAFGPSHLGILGLCAVTFTAMAILRRTHVPVAILWERVLGTLLLLIWPLTTWVHWRAGTLNYENGLPFHFCDVAGIAGGIALWSRKQLACEIVYFFGLAGTLQGLLTPNLKFDYPDARFLVFFLLHGGVVVTALHVVTAMKHAPRPGSVLRMMVVTLSYAALMGVVNALLDTNYGFLCHKPENGSLMDVLGGWPWYIGSLILLATLFYCILDLPFVIRRRCLKKSS